MVSGVLETNVLPVKRLTTRIQICDLVFERCGQGFYRLPWDFLLDMIMEGSGSPILVPIVGILLTVVVFS